MFAALGKYKIIPLLKIREIETDAILRVCEALIRGGLPVIEINFRRHSDSKAIREIARNFPEFLVGAGSILSRDQLLRAFDCKAKFATAPGFSAETMKIASKRKIAFAPGVTTPSDIENILMQGGVDFQFFPAEAAGGVEYLKAIIEPYEHLPVDIFPKGGITMDNAAEYLKLPQVCAVALEGILKNEYIVNEQWDKITDAAREALRLVASIS